MIWPPTEHRAHVSAALLGVLLAAAQPPPLGAAPVDFTGAWQSVSTSQPIRTLEGVAPPLLPPAQQQLEHNRRLALDHDLSFDPAARCIPPGVPRIFGESQPFLIVQRPYEVLFLFQLQRSVRRVYLRADDGAASAGAPDDSHMGSSRALWDASHELLTIDTTGFSDAGLLDDTGTPFSPQLHVTEQLRLRDANTLENLVTVDDAATFAHSWQTRYLFHKLSTLELREDVCADRLHPERLQVKE